MNPPNIFGFDAGLTITPFSCNFGLIKVKLLAKYFHIGLILVDKGRKRLFWRATVSLLGDRLLAVTSCDELVTDIHLDARMVR